MQPSMETLLNGVIDYAGLFPPASLPMEQAVGKMIEALAPGRISNWMVDKFVCPAAWLKDLTPHYVAKLDEESAFDVSALWQKAKSIDEVFPAFDADLQALFQFLSECQPHGNIDCIEVPLPEACFADVEVFRKTLSQMRERVDSRPFALNAHQIFVEWPFTADWNKQVDFVVKELAAATGGTTIADDEGVVFSLKLRTGGLDAAAIPPTEFLAAAMKQCHREFVHWKATAGLHHPFRHFDAGLGAAMHGFLNVAIADAIGHTYPELEMATLIQILEEQNEVRFQFAANSIRWKDVRIHINEVADARWRSFGSFGSCSIDEPVDELNRFGLL